MDFPGHFEQIFQQLNHQRLHGQLCDCVITVGGRHFKAHRSVLSACSTHFRALFTADGDAGTGSVLLDSEVVTAEAFSALMDMMYTSTLMLGSSNVMDVLLAASHLHLNAVVKACKRYLTTRTLPLSPPAARGGSGTHFQRSVLLQQLGLSLVSSALSGAEDEGTRLHRRSGSTHSFLKRKLSPLVGTSPPGCGPLDDSEGGENLLLPDSHGKMVDEGGEYRAVLMHDDVQLPSQSDGDGGREPRKEEYADPMKSNPEEDERHVQVVVKSEPLPSPDHTSPTQVEPVGEKVELSPDGSDRSFFDSQHGSDLLIKAVSGAREEREGRSSDGLLCGKASSALDNVPNTTTAEFQDSSRFFLPSSSSTLQLLPPDGPDLQAESLFLRPAFEGMAAAHGGNMDQLALDFQRNILGLQTQFPRSPRGDAPAASYRRIAPKLPSGSGGEAQAASANPPPQLTRASADVLSKCKKALSEHNVLVVEGARKYACKICCKTFLTLTDCKKHIRVHTGERPYACLKCGKRFSQSSHLYKHSKTTCLRWQSPAGLL